MTRRSSKRRGAKPKYKKFHVLLTLLLLDEFGPIGRYSLSDYLGLSEASTRSILKRLNDVGLSHSPGQYSGRQGNWLSTKGMQLVKKLKEHVQLVRVRVCDIFPDFEWGILVRNGGKLVKDGIRQRDEAVRAGAHGAITLTFRDGYWLFPETGKKINVLGIDKPIENDALIIAFDEENKSVFYGSIAAAYNLINRPTIIYFEGQI